MSNTMLQRLAAIKRETVVEQMQFCARANRAYPDLRESYDVNNYYRAAGILRREIARAR